MEECKEVKATPGFREESRRQAERGKTASLKLSGYEGAESRPVHVPAATTGIRYRSFGAADIAAAHGLSMALGWAYAPEDWQFSADTAMAFVVEEDGVVIGTAMCWKFGADRASIGHLIVSPAHQGRGLGRGLMELLLQEVGSRMTFLHATPAGRPLYEKLGFVVCGSLEQYQGTVAETIPMALPDGEKLRIATPEDFPFLIEMDARASGLERPALLSALLRRGQSLVLERHGRIIGFSVLRPFGWGYAIGPVIAPGSPDERYARALIGYWLASRQGEFVRVDIPVGAMLTDWLPRQGLKLVDVCSKMVRNASADESGGPPDPAYRLYALISQAML